MYYIFSFRSRSNALKFAQNLKKEGAKAEVISTPSTIYNGCGLSVKTNNEAVAKRTLQSGKYATYMGYFLVKDYNGVLNITKK